MAHRPPVAESKVENAATVRGEMAGWVDYMHLAKVDGEWKIVNVLWATKPKK